MNCIYGLCNPHKKNQVLSRKNSQINQVKNKTNTIT